VLRGGVKEEFGNEGPCETIRFCTTEGEWTPSLS